MDCSVREKESLKWNTFTSQLLVSLFDIWHEIGFKRDDIAERANQAFNVLNEVGSEMIHDEKALRDKFKSNINNNILEAKNLYMELEMPPTEINIDGMSLIDADATTSTKCCELRALKSDRVKAFHELKEVEEKLCIELDSTPCFIIPGKCPSQKQLSDVSKSIRDLRSLKETRFNSYKDMKKEIMALYVELEEKPDCALGMEVYAENDENFKLTSANMERLEGLYKSLRRKLEQNKIQAAEYQEKLKNLWSRIQVPIQEQTKFLTKCNGYKSSDIKTLEQELQRCEEIKKQHIVRLIDNVRSDIKEYWSKCCVGEEEKAQFEPFYSNQFDEACLMAHENELERLKKRFEKYKKLFEDVYKWRVLFDGYISFLERTKDPTRFNTRGYNSVKESQDRKRYESHLPKLEAALIKLTEDFEKENGQPFIVFGERFTETVKRERVLLEKRKENEIKERKLRSKEQLRSDLRFGSKPATPLRKRKGDATPVVGNKFRKIGETPTSSSTATFTTGGNLYASKRQLKTPSTVDVNAGASIRPARKPNTRLSMKTPMIRPRPLAEVLRYKSKKRASRVLNLKQGGFNPRLLNIEEKTVNDGSFLNFPVSTYREFRSKIGEHKINTIEEEQPLSSTIIADKS